MKNFRHELRDTPGLSSYPHPWLMPEFWQFPTVSMGLGPINAIYQARFMRYLENRGILPKTNRKIWAFLGDGEMDEPESRGALQIAANEKLDNLIFVVNCNLQRLDGPVRGNGNIVQELEGVFRGFQWNVVKLVWGSDWDRLLEKDKTGLLIRRMHECVDGEFQNYKGPRRRLRAVGVLWQISGAAGTGVRYDGRAGGHDAARRARSGEGVQRLQAGV